MTDPFALCTFSDLQGQSRPGIVIQDNVWDIGRLADRDTEANKLPHNFSMMDLLKDWTFSLKMLSRLATLALSDRRPEGKMSDLELKAPIEFPRQIFCTGANYRKHVVDLTVDMGVGPEGLDGEGLRTWAIEMMELRATEGEPYAFIKPVSAVAGPNDSLIVPATTTQLDWEIELAVVIGREGYNIHLGDAMNYVAGYAIVNDISARDLIARTDYKMLGTDWLKAKGQPGFLPFGPLIVPACFVADPQNLSLRLAVNGQIMQDETTADMMFGIAQQIEYISKYAQLLPGDLICTGSPAGNGTHYNRYLRPGDIMTAEIEGLGIQRVECMSASQK